MIGLALMLLRKVGERIIMKPARTIKSGWNELTVRLSSSSQSCLVEPGLRLRKVLSAVTFVGIGGSHCLALSKP